MSSIRGGIPRVRYYVKKENLSIFVFKQTNPISLPIRNLYQSLYPQFQNSH